MKKTDSKLRFTKEVVRDLTVKSNLKAGYKWCPSHSATNCFPSRQFPPDPPATV
jgi:hypothetical protein